MFLTLRLFKRLDLALLISVGLLLFFGLFVVYSATFDQFPEEAFTLVFLFKQLLAIAIGLILMFAVTYVDYHVLQQYAELIYFLLIALLLAVISIGQTTAEVQRWLHFGFLNLQPSEFAKIGVVLILAKYLSGRKGSISNLVDLLPAICALALPFILVFKQPDLGTAFIFLAIFLGMSYWAGARPLLIFLISSPLISIFILRGFPFYPWISWGLYLLFLIYILNLNKINLIDSLVFLSMNVLTAVVTPLLWNSLKGYQQQRLLSFINPAVDPLAQGIRYHTAKSVIAIGSGGIWGQGFLKGPLAHLQYIPEHHTDFIFTVIGEEFGLIGTILVIGLLGYILFRGIKIAASAEDEFGSLLASGVVLFLGFQAVVNIGMTIGILPVVGIPLPFLSAGGSAMVVSLVAIGLLESVAIHQKKLFF